MGSWVHLNAPDSICFSMKFILQTWSTTSKLFSWNAFLKSIVTSLLSSDACWMILVSWLAATTVSLAGGLSLNVGKSFLNFFLAIKANFFKLFLKSVKLLIFYWKTLKNLFINFYNAVDNAFINLICVTLYLLINKTLKLN